jgi:tubulin beta
MGAKFWEVMCEAYGIGGRSEYGGENDEHLGRISLFYHGPLGGKYVPRAVLFDLEPGVIGAVTPSRRSANSSARATSWTIRAIKNWEKGYYEKVKRQYGKNHCEQKEERWR